MSQPFTCRWIAAALLAMLAATSAFGQSALRPGQLSKAELAALEPGLTLQFYTLDDLQTPYDTRLVRVAALHVPGGEPPTPFHPPGLFVARLTGYIKAPLKGTHAFHIESTHKIAVRINGGASSFQHSADEPVTANLAGVELVKGYNTLEVTFLCTAQRDAGFRIGWSSSEFPVEPLPTDALFTRGDDKHLLAGQLQRMGRDLFASRSCVQCHRVSEDHSGKFVMPELSREAPSLVDIGSRVKEPWLRAWLVNPQHLRPTATMPQVLPGDAEQQAQAAADIAAYLTTLTKAQPSTAEPAIDEQVAAGKAAFENLGCVACHSTLPPDVEDPFARQTLHFVQAKFAEGHLQQFLQAPQQHYAWSRMPDFRLSVEEAGALAAFLNARTTSEIKPPPAATEGNVARGQKLFTSTGCASCHRIDDQPPSAARLLPLPAEVSATGCLAELPADRAPRFGFTAEQQRALQSFLATDRMSLRRDTLAEFSQRQIKSLNCIACHRRDAASSVLSLVLSEEGEQGLTPEVLPLLTWSGEKLKPAWTEKLLAGQLDQQARPWLRTRMPAFPTQAKWLATGLSHEHGFAIDENPRPPHDAALAKVGAQLVGEHDGFSCIKCHGIGQQPPLAPFEAPGINLVSAAERLRYTYYPRWMFDPPRVDVLTKMPKFSADGKTTGVSALDGNAARQYEALWHYLQTLPTR